MIPALTGSSPMRQQAFPALLGQKQKEDFSMGGWNSRLE